MSWTASTSKSKYTSTVALDLAQYPHLPQTDLFRFLKELPSLDVNGPWVAGGAVWRTVNNQPLDNCDIDVFFPNKEAYEEGVRRMNSLPFVNRVITETKNKYNTIFKYHVSQGKTYNKTVDVQLIGMDYTGSLSQLLEGFDFTVCQFGFDGKNLIAGHNSVNDLAKKQLRIYQIRRPKGMIQHMLKYMNNGFTLDDANAKFLFSEMLKMDIWSKKAGEDYNGNDNEKMKNYDKEWAGAVVGAGDADAGEWQGFGYNAARVQAAPIDPPPAREERGERPRRRGNRGGGEGRGQVIREVAPAADGQGWVPGAGVMNVPLAYQGVAYVGNGGWVAGNAAGMGWAPGVVANNPPQPAAAPEPAPAPPVDHLAQVQAMPGLPVGNIFNLDAVVNAAANPPQPEQRIVGADEQINQILNGMPQENAVEENEWEEFGYAARLARQGNNQNEQR